MSPTAVATHTSDLTSDNKATPSSSSSSPAALEIVLDYPDWAGNDASSSSRHEFVSALRKSMVGLGFFYLRNSPLEPLRKDLFEATREFFDLDEEQRGQIDQANSPHFRGYSRIGMEYTQSKPDNRAQIDIGIEAPEFPAEIKQPEYLRLWGPNQFPKSPERLRSIVLSYIEAAEPVTIELTAALEEALGVPAGRLQDQLALHEKGAAFEQVQRLKDLLEESPNASQEEVRKSLPARLPYYRMKLVQYGKEGNEQGVGAHRDGGWITLLATDDQPGLQVEDLDGTWLDVPLRDSCILVNFGQQLERVSNGLINAATHRVSIKPSPRNRISTPYFSMPNMRAVLKPISTDEMSTTVLNEWEAVQQDKKSRVSSVPEGDLHGGAQQSCGEMAWSGLTRSHPATFQRWYGDGSAR